MPKSSSLSASPKSATTGLPAASSRMLAGLMSRWTRPRVWAWCSASATVATSSADSPKGHPALTQPLRQVAALDVLGDDVAEAVVGAADVVDRDDVGVVELGEDLGLGQVGLDVLGAGDPLGVGHLDRHRPVEVVVLGQVDRPNPPRPSSRMTR